jgi:hypothetical protein
MPACLIVMPLGNLILLFRSIVFVSVLLIASVVPAVWAEPVEGLYSVSVAVSSQSEQDLNRAGQEALRTVFIRVSGNVEVLEHPAIAQAIRQARNYTRQFQYERVLNQEDNSEQLLAVLEFEPDLVDRQLREAGLPLWSSNRPTVLVWLVVEDQEGRRFVSAERDAEIIAAIMDNATRRGLALKLPALDLEDMVALSPEDIWQFNVQRMQSAVERYPVDSALFGQIAYLSNGRWLGRWQYQFDGQQLEFEGDAETIGDYIGASVDQVAQLLAAKYAISPVKIAEGGVLMRLTGVRNFIDYARAIRYLEGIAAIQHANVVSIEGDEIIIHLIAEGMLLQLKQAFALDKYLIAEPAGSYQGNYPIVLDYQWPADETES